MQVSKNALLRLLLLLLAATMFVALSCEDDEGGDGDGATATSEDGDGDTSEIPEDTTGVTDTEIVLGTHMPLTGIAAPYGTAIAPAIEAYFNYINDQGGINGRTIRFIIKDDGYEPPQTNAVVRELVEQDGIFALVSGLGTAQHSAAFEYLAEAQVPDMFIASGATLFTDPITPTAFGYNPNYIQEGDAIGKYIVENHPGAKVGVIRQNDDFGADGLAGVEQGIEGSDVEIISEQTYEAANTDLTAQVQRAQNDGVEVLVGYALPRQAGSLVSVARGQLDWDVPIIVSGVVADPITIALMGGEENAEGVISTAYLKPLIDEDDPGVQQHIEIMGEFLEGAEPSNFTIYGQSVAETMVAVLEAAGQDLNRRTLIEAAESLTDFTCTLCLAPINLSPTDHRPIEAFSFARAEGGVWVPFGDLVSYESTGDGDTSGDEAEPTETPE
jgi:ABC-type branched-subunit amino acid transport system substrate-binding protein